MIAWLLKLLGVCQHEFKKWEVLDYHPDGNIKSMVRTCLKCEKKQNKRF